MLPGSTEAFVMLRKLQDGDTDEFVIFRVNISLRRNYRVKYYDYIVKWCSGIAMLDIS